MAFLLLDRFRALFSGTQYDHRNWTLGDSVAVYLTEDIYALDRSGKLRDRIAAGSRVQNVQNKRRGVIARRGDGTFGELIPGAAALRVAGYEVARGPIATVEIGVEVKVLCKAMMKQIDRVMQNMENQVKDFLEGGGQPISIGIVGINHAAKYTSLEGKAVWPTDGTSRYKHPIQEAAKAESVIRARVAPHYSELIFLRFRAGNEPPYKFEWVDEAGTEMDYAASVTRVIRRYEQQF